MSHRNYGLTPAKPRPTYTGGTRSAALSGRTRVVAIIGILIVLFVVLYAVIKW